MPALILWLEKLLCVTEGLTGSFSQRIMQIIRLSQTKRPIQSKDSSICCNAACLTAFFSTTAISKSHWRRKKPPSSPETLSGILSLLKSGGHCCLSLEECPRDDREIWDLGSSFRLGYSFKQPSYILMAKFVYFWFFDLSFDCLCWHAFAFCSEYSFLDVCSEHSSHGDF